MRERLRIATRKGLFTAEADNAHWLTTKADFLGENVSLTLTDPRDGACYAALDQGHFGVKLHRATAGGWEEIATPAYPPTPEGYEEFETAGRCPGRQYASGPWKRAAPMSPAPCGAAHVPADCSNRTTAAAHGRLFRHYGSTRSARNGWVAARTCPACIRSASIRAMLSASPIAVSTGSLPHTTDGGETCSSAERACGRPCAPLR